MIPDQFLQELKYRSDIEQIIGSYVNLRRRGRTLSGLCPFHSEKSPSFTVYPENQSFYCFGCGAGGADQGDHHPLWHRLRQRGLERPDRRHEKAGLHQRGAAGGPPGQ